MLEKKEPAENFQRNKSQKVEASSKFVVDSDRIVLL